MLLLVISLFSNYDLFHCNQAGQATFRKTRLSDLLHKSIHEMDSLLEDFQQEIRKEKSVLRAVDLEIQDADLLDHSMSPVWWSRFPGKHTQTTLFLYPPGHFTTTTKDPWDSWNLPSLQYHSPSHPSNSVPSPGHMPDFGYRLNQTPPLNTFATFDRTMPLYGSTNVNYSVSFTRPSYSSTVPSRTAPTSLFSPGSSTFKLTTRALLPRPGHMRSVTARPKARTLSEFFAMSDLHEKVMRDRTWYRPPGLAKANRMTAASRRPQQRKRTLSKAQAWVQNRQWMKTNKPGRTLQGHMREGTDDPLTKPTPIPVYNLTTTTPLVTATLVTAPLVTAPLVTTPLVTTPLVTTPLVTFSMPGLSDILPSMSLPGTDEVPLTTAAKVSVSTTQDPFAVDTMTIETAFTAELFQEDDAGFLFVTSPASIYVHVTERTTNTFGQVLLNAENFTASTPPAAPHRVYHDLMEAHNEGYLTVFLLELARLVAHKAPRDAGEVLAHTEIIYNKLYEQNSLAFLGETMLDLGTKVSQMFSGTDISVLRNHANMMHQMLTGRAQFLSVEVNSIIDYADLLYEDDEGEYLFEALRIFEAFPNVGASSYDVCLYLIENFIKPYRRLRNSARLRRLIDSITKVVATKFGHMRSGGDLTWSNTTTPEPNQTINKTKHKPSLRRRIEFKRHRMKRPKDQQDNQYKHRRQVYDTVPTILRNMLPITKHQKRFRVITPKQLKTNGYMGMVRPTMAYFRRRLGRPVHPQKGVLQLFPEAGDVEYRRRVQPAHEETHHLKEPAHQQTLGAMRDKVRRIVEESSYSDEEASLKMYLRHALRINWLKTSTPSLKTSDLVAK